jgi:hypothetical protein
MQTCKTCDWWKKWDHTGRCTFVDTMESARPETRFEIEVEADDDQGLTARLHTGPDFGCIHHSAQNAAQPT